MTGPTTSVLRTSNLPMFAFSMRRDRLLRAGLEAEALLLALRLRQPDQDLVLRRVAVLLHDLLAGQRVERLAHGGVA